MYIANPQQYGAMPYRASGKTGLKLPSVTLGMWHNFGDATPMETQRDMLRTAFNLGITHFDFANNHGPPYGSAESLSPTLANACAAISSTTETNS